MSKPKVFVYTPLDESGVSYDELAEAGCEVVLGDLVWRTKMGATHDDVLQLGASAQAMILSLIHI